MYENAPIPAKRPLPTLAEQIRTAGPGAAGQMRRGVGINQAINDLQGQREDGPSRSIATFLARFLNNLLVEQKQRDLNSLKDTR